MAEKNLNNIRIVNKHDTEVNWLKATGFTPKQGELIVYDIDDNYNYERIKIGDGAQNVNALPFITETVDWNDLLNRPFGEFSEYYVNPRTIECTDIHYLYVNSDKSVTIGETYTVVFDGVEYECECLNYKRFGNLSLYYDDMEDTGEPFLLRYDGMVNGYVLTVKETGTHTISIEQKVVECIDEKYIPETIARVADLPSLDGLASESYVDDKITEFVGDTPVAEQIAAAETEMSGIYAPIDSPVFTSNISFGRKADTTVGYQSVALGSNVEASGYLANATGSSTVASGPMSHAEGASSKSTSDSSHAEGGGTTASGSASHAEGRSTVASGSMAHSEGYMTTASGEMSHAEGNNTSSEGSFSHAEGLHTVTRSDSSHVQGQYNIVEPYISNVETLTGTIKVDSNGHWIFDSYTFDSSTGKYTPSDTTKYTSLPNNTTQYFAVKPSYVTATTCTEMFRFTDITAYSSSSVTGTYEHYVSALEHDYAHVVGNGEDADNRSNAHTLDWDGNAWFAGNVTIGVDSKELATQEYVDNAIAEIPTPDVSGQINEHNESETAHSDIRTAINNVASLVGDTAVSEQINTAIDAIPEATWESLPDKPFGIVTKSATNIGVPDDAVTDSEGQLVKVSNDTIPADIFTSTILSNEDFSMSVGSSQTYISEDIAVCEVMVVAYKENVTYTAGSTTYTYPEVGIYLPLASTVELTATWEETKLLDSNFIGSDIARVEDIPEGFSGSWNDLSDRPFYYDSNSEIVVEDLEAVTGTWTGTTDAGATASQIETMNDAFDVIFELGCQYKVTYNGVNYYVTATDDGYGNVCLGTYSYYELTETMPFSIHNYYNDYKGVYQFSGYVIGDAGSTHTFSVEKVDENILLLDEKYISHDIARVSDIPSIEGLATETYVDTKVADLVNSAPETLDTLNELAAALGNDENFAATVAGQIGALEEKVGDTSVSEQIEASQIVYVGPTAPTDPNIKVWVNTSVEGAGVIPVLPRITTITLVEANWVGNTAPYSQVVTIPSATAVSKVDLQPTVSQIISMQSDDIALMAENLDGVVTIYSFGGKPTGDMTMQVMLTEVSYV